MSEQGNFYTDPNHPGRGFCLLIRDGKPFAGTWFDFDRDGNQCWLTLDPPDDGGVHILRRPKGSGFGEGTYEGAGQQVGTISFDQTASGFTAEYSVDRDKLDGRRLEFSPTPDSPFYMGTLNLVPVVG